MSWLPRDDWAIETELPVEELRQGLMSRVGSKGYLWDSGPARLRGHVSRAGFVVRRSLSFKTRATVGQNGVPASMFGEFDPHENGTTIHMRLRMSDFVPGFLAVWFGIVAMFGLIALYVLVTQGQWIFLAGSVVMLFLGVLVVRFISAGEAERSRDVLEEVIGEIEEERCPRT